MNSHAYPHYNSLLFACSPNTHAAPDISAKTNDLSYQPNSTLTEKMQKYYLTPPPPPKSHLNHFENSKYHAGLNNHEYTTNQHMEMVSKVDGERWQLKDKLGVVDIDRAVLPHTLQAEVPKVNHVSVITKPTHQQYTQADTLWWNMNSSNCLRNHGARAKVPNANHLTLYQQLTTYFTTHTHYMTHTNIHTVVGNPERCYR